ncbi:response regulator [Roseomonas sp. OT10]|nr:response regulator [Roseomonas sp. OT10]
MANSAPALIWVTDSRGGLVFANRHAETLFGIPAERLHGEGWLAVVHPDDVPTFHDAFRRAFDARQPFHAESRVRDRHGEIRWLRCEGAPLFDATGSFLGYTGCNLDVTATHRAAEALEQRVTERTAELAAANHQLRSQIEERERMEAGLRQMQRLEAVGQLTAGVAHDFNNLLTVILGNVRLLARAATDATQQRRLEMVRLAGERGAALTHQLLAFSRRQRLEPRTVDLNATIAELAELLRSTVGGRVKLDISLSPEPWPAQVDPTQLELVILNLALNARDAMPGGGSLRVGTSNVTMGEPERPHDPPAGEYVAISVADTGPGMPAAVRDRMFEPFFTTKPVGAGSGLGLSQVLGFAQQSGGGVRVEAEEGRGTTVSVLLPRAAGTAPAGCNRPAAPAARAQAADRLVLLVDDDSAVRETTAAALRDLGYRVVEAGSGGAALDLLDREAHVDLLLLDFAMPGMNGVEVAQAARSRRPGVPVLFLTGYADAAAVAGEGQEQIIQKPFRPEDLARRLSMALGGCQAPLSSHALN